MYLCVLTALHVGLVLATGALRNLNHMYAVRDDGSSLELWVFLGSLLLIVVALVFIRPVVLIALARLFGAVTR